MNILNKLTIRHLKLNRKRTIVSIVGIILSTALMVGVGLLFSTLRDNSIRETIISRGSYHSAILDVSGQELETISRESGVKDYFLIEFIGYGRWSGSEEDSYTRIEAVDTNYLKEIKPVQGRAPKNEREILVSANLQDDPMFKIGDTVTLSTGVFLVEGEEVDSQCSECIGHEEEFIEQGQRTYTIVGYYGTNPYISWAEPTILTKLSSVSKSSYYNVYLHMNQIEKTGSITNSLIEKLGEKEVEYNSSLLGLSGISKYDNIIGSLIKSMVVLLSLISIGCIVVIYNSFAISVLERKKQFGLFASIGATKKQIRKTVLFEAIVVGTIGILFGILGAFVGIGVVLMIINQLLPNLLDGGAFRLCVYPIFMIVPILFMILTILISAFIPAQRASKISPIEAIRLNDDIKIPAKKLKTPWFIRTLFKEEGVIAYKNMKRNKKKYRITVISLFISIVLFLSFSAYMKLIFRGVNNFVSNPSFDVSLNISMTSLTNQEIVELRNEVGVKQSFYGIEYSLVAIGDLKNQFTDEFRNRYMGESDQYNISLIEVSKKDFEMYKRNAKIAKDIPLIYNNFNTIQYQKNSRKSYTMKKFKKFGITSLELCETKYFNGEGDSNKIQYSCEKEIDEYAFLEYDFFGIEEYKNNNDIVMIIPEGYFGDLTEFNDGIRKIAYFDLDNSENFGKKVDSLIEQGKIEHDAYNDIREAVRYTRNMIFVARLLVYGFVSLVSLIGVTSVFNTLYTSIHLRRREFAVLRSIGLTTGGFNRMLRFECFFFGLKSLVYSLPVSAAFIVLINGIMEDVTSFGEIIWPVGSIVIVIFAVFFIIFVTTMYATRKMKKENIMDAIREENI